jgi:hypothetical protein
MTIMGLPFPLEAPWKTGAAHVAKMPRPQAQVNRKILFFRAPGFARGVGRKLAVREE